MAKPRNINTPNTNEGEIKMSVFEVMTEEQWDESGAGTSAEKGFYAQVLADFAASGGKYATISTESGKFKGRKASALSTSLKQARDSKNAPEGVAGIEVRAKKSAVYLHNTTA
jgi:hypothetical protein